jgi:hypothetical protein
MDKIYVLNFLNEFLKKWIERKIEVILNSIEE